MKNTVEIMRGNGDLEQDLFMYYLRDGEKIAVSGWHDNLMTEIALWIRYGKMPENGTFYRY